MRRSNRLFPLLPMLALGACVATEAEKPPAVSLAAGYVGGSTAPLASQAATPFWTEYRDQMLSGIVARGLAQNLSLKAAEQRIRAAGADLRSAGVLASQVGGSSGIERGASGVDGGPAAWATTGTLGASYVFDIFGRSAQGRSAATAGLRAAEAGLETARLAMLAEIIAAYSDARYYQQALALTRETINGRERTVQITRSKLELGSATGFELAQAEAQLATARAELPGLEAPFNAQVFRLATLLNEPAGPLLAQMQRGAAPLRTPAGPKTGVPADLLRLRPDIRSAEYALAAAAARVGIAEADLLPSVSLSGRVTDVSGRTAWGFGPQLSLPVFNRGALLGARDRRIAEAAEAEIAWRSAVAAGVEDVQRGLSNLGRYRQRVATLAAAVRAQDEAWRLAEANFEAGTLTLLNLLEVDRARAAARLALAGAQNDAARQWAALSIATGAGAAVK